jgi:hypothetical protein
MTEIAGRHAFILVNDAGVVSGRPLPRRKVE